MNRYPHYESGMDDEDDYFHSRESYPDDDNEDIDKCLNCGRYRASQHLNESQVCQKGCRNTAEY